MSAVTEGHGQSSEAARDPRVAAAKAIGGGDEGLEMVAHAAQGAKLDDKEEIAALDYLLGAPKPVLHSIEVLYETEAGVAPLKFIVRSIDTRKIDRIEERNRDDTTGTIDRLTADCEIVAEAAIAMEDSSRRVPLDSDEFLTVRRPGEHAPFKHASPALALEERFRDQLGLITGIVYEIKRASGFSPDRVKKAKRMMTSAALG